MREITIAILMIVHGAAAWAGGSGKANEDCFTRALLCGETRSAELTDRDCRLSDGTIGDRWVSAASTGAALEVTARSETTPIRLYLRGDEEVDLQTLAPPGEAVAHATFNRLVPNSGYFSGLVTTNPGAGNTLGRYTLSAVCDITQPCQWQHDLQACAGQRYRGGRLAGPPSRFMVEVAYLHPSGNEGFASTRPDWGSSEGTNTSFPEPYGQGLLTRFFRSSDRVELRYVNTTPSLPFRMGVTDRASGQTAFFSNAENECGDSARDTFPAADAPVQPCNNYRRGREDRSIGCFLDKRFKVELTWTDPRTGKSGKGWMYGVGLAPHSQGSINFKKGPPFDSQVIVRFDDTGDHVDLSFGSFSDWEYTLKVTDTSTGEVRTYHNPAGRICAVVVPDVFGD